MHTVFLRQEPAGSSKKKDFLVRVSDGVRVPDGCAFFKNNLRELFDDWLLHGEKSYTNKGNIRAVSKTTLCDMVVEAWKKISEDLIIKSFKCT